MSPTYDGPERRSGDIVTEDRVQLMIAEAVSKALREHEQHLVQHMDKQFAALRVSFAEAFPDGDPHGHRVAHQKMIANAGWWEKAKNDAFVKVSALGVWAVFIFLCVAAWEHIKSEVRK